MKPLDQLPPNGTWMTPKEVILFIPRSLAWLEKNRRNKTGPAYFTVGRNIYYTPENIREWMEHQVRKGGDAQ